MNLVAPPKKLAVLRRSLAAALRFLVTAFVLCVGSHGALAQEPPPIRINPNVNTIAQGNCGTYFQLARTFRLGKILHPVEGPFDSTLPKKKRVYTRFTSGTEVVISGQIGNLVCVARYNQFSAMGWVPRKSVELLDETVAPTAQNWSGVWAAEGGDWFEIYVNLLGNASIVDGRACWAQCDHVGSLGGALATLAAWHGPNSQKTGLQSTLFFELPKRHFDMRDACTPTHGPPYTSCRSAPIPTDVANSCRFYANLIPGGRLIVSDEHGSCGGLNVSWSGMYYKVAPYPPYARMKAYFKKLGKPFKTLPEQIKTRCPDRPYGACPWQAKQGQNGSK
jgi:hypothetical protein